VGDCVINSPHSTQYTCIGFTSGNCSCSQIPCPSIAEGTTETTGIGLVYLGPLGNQTVHCGYHVNDGTPDPPKNNGDPKKTDCKLSCSNPVNTGTGGKYQREVDFARPSEGGLEFVRHYNSGARGSTSSVGANWQHNWALRIEKLIPAEVYATRGDGVRRTFVANGSGGWIGEADTPDVLVQTAGGWTLTTRNNEVETYDSEGRILTSVDAMGRTTTFAYSDGTAATATIEGTSIPLSEGILIRVTDFKGRSMSFGYNASGYLVRMTDPTGSNYLYQFDISKGNLVAVTYPDDRTRTYHYNEPAHNGGTSQPFALTGITDENGARFATYQYDSSGRVTRSEHAAGADGHTFTYGTSGVSSYVDPLGTTRTTGHSVILGVAKRATTTQPCPGCGPSVTNTRAFDANGNLASDKDFNGNLTCFGYDLARNLETSRIEGLSGTGTCAAQVTTTSTRKHTTEWHPQWRLPKRIAEPLRITTFEYHGEPGVSCAVAGASTALLCSRTVQATTDVDGSAGFGATVDGASRTWNYTYNANGQVLTIDGPRTDVADLTTYAYYAADDPGGNYRAGDLASITNALGQVTLFPGYDGAGRLKRMVDPNGLETLLDYWPRGWLKSRMVGNAAAGFETTSYEYDFTGQLKTVTMPDGSFVAYGYDDAHRLVSIEDGLGNRIAYTLDAAGNRIAEEAYDPADTLVRAHSRVFDALSRLSQDIGGTQPALQITTSGYDANGNLVSTLDPLGRTSTQLYDSRNRLTAVRDPVNGSASPTLYGYDARDQLTLVTDPKGLSTSYAMNGHGELLAQSSPDTGVTGFTYDPASNLKSRLDARGITANYAYDALSRITQIAYPDETVTYAYDGCANGVGRLCSVSDRTGTTSWTYDIKGRVVAKTQAVGALSQTVSYGYNAAGQLASLTTPSGQLVQYAYDNNRPVSVTVNGATVLDQVFYEPFGPNGGWRWGNSTPLRPNLHVRQFDADFRATNIASSLPLAGGASAIAKSYAWDEASRITSIEDIANAALSATYGYDGLDRLTSAATGSSSWGYGYDGVGNRLTSTNGAASTSYTYAPGSHRLQSLSGAQVKAYTFDAAGNMTSDGIATWTYGGSGRPTQVQAGATTTALEINALGQRVRKASSSGATRFVHDEAGRLIGEYGDDGTLRTEIVWLGELPVAIVSAQTRQAGVNGDIDGDAVPDLVFRHAQTGDTFTWMLNADRSFRTSAYLGTIDVEWDLVGMKDINGDGHLDAVWRNSVTGAAYVWFFNGLQYTGFDYLFTVEPAFKIAAVDDFNGDGRMDFVLRHVDTGMAILWYFDGTQYLGGEYMFTLDPAWKIGGSADVNGDGHTDLLVSSTATGDAGVWYLNGAQYQGEQYIGTMQAGWVLAHVADFDGDLKADAVIRETASGVAFLEFLDGAQVVGEEWFFNIEPAWQLGPAGEQFQKAAGSAAPLVNRPLPPGFTKPTFERLAGRGILAPRRLSIIGRIPSPADHKGPIPPGPTPPTGKRFAKSMVGATPAALYYVTPDHLGTPRAITRPTDNRIVWRWDNTEPFGNSPPNENPLGVGNFTFNLRFPGQYFDAETGTHYNYFRDYDPAIGRYVQSDPIGLDGGLNTYGYVDGAPLAFVDVYGLAKKFPADHQHCKALRDKMDNLRKELDDRWSDYAKDVKNLPERIGPGEALGATRRGHRTLINDRDSKLRGYEKRYSDECEEECKEQCPGGAGNVLSSMAAGAAATGSLYLMYRCVRMLPSFAPPLWWTIPANAAAP
jgi:RHS repeat-associated protein